MSILTSMALSIVLAVSPQSKADDYEQSGFTPAQIQATGEFGCAYMRHGGYISHKIRSWPRGGWEYSVMCTSGHVYTKADFIKFIPLTMWDKIDKRRQEIENQKKEN